MQEHGPAWHPTVSLTCHQGCTQDTALGCGRAIVPPFLPLCLCCGSLARIRDAKREMLQGKRD